MVWGKVDPAMVQNNITRDELLDQISKCQKQKRDEMDIMNIQEFCEEDDSAGFSCARTRAVMVRTKGSNGHLKITKIENNWGPLSDCQNIASDQTSFTEKDHNADLDNTTTAVESIEDTSKQVVPEGIEERVLNMEWHLKLYDRTPAPKSFQERLKNMDFHVLYYEGIHPEDYQTETDPSAQIDFLTINNFTPDELEQHMHKLKHILHNQRCGAQETDLKEASGSNQHVQYNISVDELHRRIKAYQKFQQRKKNLFNMKKLSSDLAIDEFSCARVKSIDVHRMKRNHSGEFKFCGKQNHLDDEALPQSEAIKETDPGIPEAETAGPSSTSNELSYATDDDFDFLLDNEELFSNLTRYGPTPKALYKVIQTLENRIMHLERVTPYIFQLENIPLPTNGFSTEHSQMDEDTLD